MYKIRTTKSIPHISGQITHHRTLKQIGDEKKNIEYSPKRRDTPQKIITNNSKLMLKT